MHNLMLLLIFSIFCLIWKVDSALVTTSLGQVDGAESGEHHLFKKIPFAKPPLGNLRFQKPEPVEKWVGVLNAKEYGPACMSNSSTTKSPQKWVDEDCLHVNIFSSDKCFKSKNCAVVFYIHGGYLNFDSAVMFNDTYLLETFVDQDVILVIPAFRLGIFSHFVVEDQNIAPSNLALYDILQALEFVKNEIQNFGGDNKKVTLMGHSYGGTVASMMAFSTKINQDLSLFQQTISMSSSLEVDSLEFQIEKSRNFSKRAGCLLPSKLAEKFSQSQMDFYTLKCLQKMDAKELLRIQRQLEEEGYPKPKNLIIRGPLFQEVSYYEFMDTPNRIPMLTGCTKYEMDHQTTIVDLAAVIGFENLKEVDEKYRSDLVEGVDFGNHSDETQMFILETKMRVDKLVSKGIPTYLYEYSYPKHSHHTDDLSYIMGVHPFERDENEKHLAEVYQKMFMNFAKNGQPGNGFELANLENATYYDVNWNEKTGQRPQMKTGYEQKLIDYWFREMKEYDKKITAEKMKNKKSPSARFYSESSPHFQYPYMYITMLMISMIFLTGCLLGRCCFRGDQTRNLYIRLDGNDHDYHVVKDF